MTEIIDLDDWLKAQADKFETRKKLLFKSIWHKPTEEKVVDGYRYFNNSIEELLAALDSGDFANVLALDYSLDEDGDPDTSSVALLLAYTKSGAFFAVQPQQYQDYVPTLIREPVYVTATLAQFEELDQTN